MKKKSKKLNEELKLSTEGSKILSESERRYMKLLKKKETELAQMEVQLNKLKSSTRPKKKLS